MKNLIILLALTLGVTACSSSGITIQEKDGKLSHIRKIDYPIAVKDTVIVYYSSAGTGPYFYGLKTNKLPKDVPGIRRYSIGVVIQSQYKRLNHEK